MKAKEFTTFRERSFDKVTEESAPHAFLLDNEVEWNSGIHFPMQKYSSAQVLVITVGHEIAFNNTVREFFA